MDAAQSTDRRKSLDPDRFGYLSVHYVVRLSHERGALSEYRKYADIPVEVQVRSVLQHAWAEIEHDLGYKTKEGIPSEFRRRFSRLAGLLELADSEFVAIRDALSGYRARIKGEVAARQSVELNRDSLLALLHADPHLRSLDEAVAGVMGANLEGPVPAIVERVVAMLRYLELDTTEKVVAEARLHLADVRAFAETWLAGAKYSSTSRSIGLFYLGYLLVARSGQESVVKNYLDVHNIGGSDERQAMILSER